MVRREQFAEMCGVQGKYLNPLFEGMADAGKIWGLCVEIDRLKAEVAEAQKTAWDYHGELQLKIGECSHLKARVQELESEKAVAGVSIHNLSLRVQELEAEKEADHE